MGEEKNIFRATCNKPLRFAILGPHRSSKSAFVSIISNQISLENYYPTLQNSPILLQFQPKREKSRAILDVNITLDDLDHIGLLNGAENCKISMSKKLMERINRKNLELKKKLHNCSNSAEEQQLIWSLHSSESVLSSTKHYYDLDYTKFDMFKDESFSPINSFHSPIASFSLGRSFGNSFSNSVGMRFPGAFTSMDQKYQLEGEDEDDHGVNKYKPPVTTPILIELIDTPGVQQDDLIPFLERSLDSRLSRDVLSNLANEYNTNYRSRVKPLIIGSGISDLNASVDGYLLFYSCIPENDDLGSLPPSYDDVSSVTDTTSGDNSIEILKSLYVSICDAWKEYTRYQNDWESGKEYDTLSLTSSIKQLWKDKDKDKDAKKKATAAGKNARGKDNLYSGPKPPVVVICSYTDSPQAAPLLINQGRQLAEEWGSSFIEMSCAYSEDQWLNVEEALAVAVREAINSKSN